MYNCSYAGMLNSDPWMGVVGAPPRDGVVRPPEGGDALVVLHTDVQQLTQLVRHDILPDHSGGQLYTYSM